MPSHICQYKERFNSQRDGILRKDGDRPEARRGVSIPNGTEFYHNLSFRDFVMFVSIPNGIELY